MATTYSGWRYLLGFRLREHISCLVETHRGNLNFSYSQKILSEAMSYKVIKLLLIIQKLKG